MTCSTQRQISNRMAVLHTLADELKLSNPSEAVVLSCEMYLRMNLVRQDNRRHVDSQPLD